MVIGSAKMKLLSLTIMPPRVRSIEHTLLGINVCNGVLRIVRISDLGRYGARGKHHARD